MQAATNVPKGSPASNLDSAISSVSGTLNGRQVTSAPAASPRISCHSRWWNALAEGGVKGWYNWLVRVQKYERLSVAERLDKPRQAAAYICTALAQAASNQKINPAQFNELVKDGRWYGVDVSQVIDSAFLTSKLDTLEKIKSACDGKRKLRWLVQKIDRKLEKLETLKAQVKDGVYKSAMLSTEGFLVNGPSQNEFWKEMDQSFDSVGNCHLEEHVGFALSLNSPWVLLPFAELQFNRVPAASKVLEQVCIQAWKKISVAKTIDFTKLTDVELSKFLLMVNHHELKHHASACKNESERRAHIVKCTQLMTHLEQRVKEITSVSPSLRRTDAVSSRDKNLFGGLSEQEISRVALKVIVKLSPADVFTISKLESERLSDMWLNEIAKAQIKTPSVALMNDAVLISYLATGESKILPTDVLDRLETEAGRRAKKMYEESYARLQGGLQSDSCNQLVRAVLESSSQFKRAAQLDDVSSLDESRKALPDSFAKMLTNLKGRQKTRARHLAIKLRDIGQKETADHLNSAIQKLRGPSLVPLNERENQLFADALSQYVPSMSHATSQASATLTDIELGKKFLDLFNAYILSDDDFRRIRNLEEGELPVSAQFVKDQRLSNLQVEGRPVFNQHISFPDTADTKRAQEFVKEIRALKGVSDEQIMTASRIASQSATAVLALLAHSEKLYSLTDEEANAAGVSRDRLAFIPSGLDHQENFVRNEDSSLTVHVRIFNENVEHWSGGSSGPEKTGPITVETDPEKSSFSAELRFEIDAKGIIQEVVLKNSVVERAGVRKVDDAYSR